MLAAGAWRPGSECSEPQGPRARGSAILPSLDATAPGNVGLMRGWEGTNVRPMLDSTRDLAGGAARRLTIPLEQSKVHAPDRQTPPCPPAFCVFSEPCMRIFGASARSRLSSTPNASSPVLNPPSARRGALQVSTRRKSLHPARTSPAQAWVLENPRFPPDKPRCPDSNLNLGPFCLPDLP